MGRLVLAVTALGAAAAVSSAFAAGAATPRLTVVARGLQAPVYVTQAPGQPNRYYVVEQEGRIRIVERGRVRGTFLDIRPLVQAGGEQGLLGLAFAPQYARNRTFYVKYTARPGDRNVVVRYRASGTRALSGSAQEILSVPQPYSNHDAGHLAFGPDGWLWVGTGDGGSGGDPEDRAQNPDSPLGKMFRLDVSQARPEPQMVALGLRNPWRYSFDRRTGHLWIGDVGQGEIEEVDRLLRGTTGLVNFGWDVYEGRRSFEQKPLGPGRLIQPIAQYTHANGCSITGGYVYRGKAVPRLAGRYVFGDYCSGIIWSISARGGAMRREPMRVEGLTSFGEDLAGELYAVAANGTIFKFAR